MGCITVVDHVRADVSNLHRKVIHTKGRRVTNKARSSRNAMRSLSTNVSITDTSETLTRDKTMKLVRGNVCVVDASNNL